MHRLLRSPGLAALVAVAARLAVALHLGAWRAPIRFESDRLVRSWLDGGGYQITYLGATYRSFHSVLPYDLLTAASYGLFGSAPPPLLVAQAAVAAGLVLVAAALARRTGGDRAAIAAAWIVALWPPLVYYDATRLCQVGLDALLVAAGALCALGWRDRGGARRALTTGIVLGLALHERATLAPAIALLLVVAGWGRRAQLALALAAVVLVLTPWTVRNAIVQRAFVPFATTGWVNVWKGNNPLASGGELDAGGQPIVELPGALPDGVRGDDELGQAARFRAATIAFVRAQPRQAAWLYARKLGQFAWQPIAAGRDAPRSPFAAYRLAWPVLLALVVLAIARARGAARWEALLLVGVVAAFGATQALGFIAGRHRASVEPLLLVVAAGVTRRRDVAPVRVAL